MCFVQLNTIIRRVDLRISNLPRVNFGYDKAYSEEFTKTLSSKKQNAEIADMLINMNHFADNLEDLIVQMEKTPYKLKTFKFDSLVDMLGETRDFVATYVSQYFSGIKYGEDLAKQYRQEASQKKNSVSKEWRNSISEYLGGIDFEKQIQIQIKDIENYFEDAETRENNSSAVSGNLQKYEKTSSSPNGFSDVAGMDEIKARLKEEIIDPVLNPEQVKKDFEDYNITLPKGYIFYGPPGCGKTYLAKALAAESGLEMYMMDVSKIGEKFINATSNNIQSAFDFLKNRAKEIKKPVLLFMDEVDSLAMKRQYTLSEENAKTVATLLKLIEGARDDNIIVIAATNKYDDLDEAFKSRFDGHIYFPLFNKDQIKDLLKTLLSSRKKGQNLAQSEDEVDKLSQMLVGYSNRSISFFIEHASKIARKNQRSDITFNDVKKAIELSEYEKVNESEYKTSKKNRTIGFA